MILLHILILRDGDWWVAQCLEHDLGAEAKSLDDVMYAMEKTIVGQIAFDVRHGRQPFSTLPPAPDEYRDMYLKADKKTVERPRFRLPQGAPSYESDVRVCCA